MHRSDDPKFKKILEWVHSYRNLNLQSFGKISLVFLFRYWIVPHKYFNSVGGNFSVLQLATQFLTQSAILCEKYRGHVVQYILTDITGKKTKNTSETWTTVFCHYFQPIAVSEITLQVLAM